MWLKNLKIWDGRNFVDADAIEIRGDRIHALGSSDDVDAGDARDLSGLHVIPGLIDAHVHLCLNPDLRDPLAQDKPEDGELLAQMMLRAEQMLAAGITTARDLGGGRWLELEVRDRIDRREIVGPRLVCSGQPVTSVMGHCHFWGGEAADLEAAEAVIDRQIQHGVDLIKIMATGGNLTPGSTPADAQFSEAELTRMVERAAGHGLHVAAHCHGTSGIGNAARAGVTTIEHCSWVGEGGWGRAYDPEVAALIAERGAWVSPTVNLGWKRHAVGSRHEQNVIQNFERMKQSGIRMIASTDAGIPNVYHHHLPLALPQFARFASLSFEETLTAATSDCAEAIGLGQQVGTIASGYSADLVFFDGNPVADLGVLAKPSMVMSRGSFLEPG